MQGIASGGRPVAGFGRPEAQLLSPLRPALRELFVLLCKHDRLFVTFE